MRKVLSALLTVALVLSMMVTGAFAAEGGEALTASAVSQDGTTVLTLTAAQATVSGTVSVAYDAQRLTCVSVEVAGTLQSLTQAEGCVTFGYAAESAKAIPEGDTVATITFTGDVGSYTALDVTIVDFNEDTGRNELLPSVAVPEGALRFADVPKDAWFYDAVEYTAQRGWFNGIGDRLFNPNGTMNRAMFVTVLGRMAGVQPGEYGTTSFTDVKQNTYYAGYVAWALEAGITKGITATEFAPTDPVTREQAATFLYRFAQYQGQDVTAGTAALEGFADADQIHNYARSAMAWATETGLFIGYDNLLTPRAAATRAQAAKLIQRLDLLLD